MFTGFMNRKPIYFFEIFMLDEDFMLDDLSFNFKKSPMHLFWAACKCIFDSLFIFVYEAFYAKSKKV